jgi:hypothetical protein
MAMPILAIDHVIFHSAVNVASMGRGTALFARLVMWENLWAACCLSHLCFLMTSCVMLVTSYVMCWLLRACSLCSMYIRLCSWMQSLVLIWSWLFECLYSHVWLILTLVSSSMWVLLHSEDSLNIACVQQCRHIWYSWLFANIAAAYDVLLPV